MGDRGQVRIIGRDATSAGEVWLYTHWGATELPQVVQFAIKRRLRWEDDEYLARIIFCQMVKGDEDGELGFGIGTAMHGDVWRVIEINVPKQTVTMRDNGGIAFEESFESFCKKDLSKYGY